MIRSARLSEDEDLKFREILEESGLSVSELIKAGVFNTQIISRKDEKRYREIYKKIHELNKAVMEFEAEHPTINTEKIERAMVELCHSLSNM